ncbi:hypothetical protein AB0909_00585 [Streptomyces albidoflavus]|uniref:hypothetical protein n=1 Tax=Streptomyces albidoflavus TaxID=1886 RepID=UPI00345309C5
MPEPLTVTEDQVRGLRAGLDALLPDERITQLTDERDRARRWAVGLEQENAELTRRLSEIPRTEQCGHDDYHDPHPWADQQNVSCPGHSYEAAQ